ncbi:SnoaL-like protein [Blastococcus colisei]|uniref:SnoaL-like protein n=1 Tax=Blastococcus colisei TaxID=1564162 RepID=A0A543PHC5_9ACTN|nr:nuclear transport factor 2 family protein [Blastococcus colisei]TQN43486.1 SnoaL-like protein [Blastococcus colisei]
MARTPQDVFAAHASALAAGDIGRILEDYSDDAVLLTADGPFHGHKAIGEFLTAALGALPEAEFTVGAAVFEGDALLLVWSVTSPKGKITDAVDTFVFADGKIRLQTTVFHVEPA